MCGIAGIIYNSGKVEDDLLKRMSSTLKHRGPDDTGSYIARDSTAGLCHARLSIIDLVGGHQPMSSACRQEGRTVWIVFNGEIYNFQELKNGLVKRGHIFKTASDTEVILHLYEEKGVNCLDDISGMFAFAIYDEFSKSLFLARDRLGKKPLSYYYDGNKFIFASEIKAILEDSSVPRRINLNALEHYLTFLYVPPPDSMFDGIMKLPPASYLIFKDDKVEVKQYWQPQIRLTDEPFELRCKKIRDSLTKAVEMRLISDVPLGAFLSGGVDSSLVVGLMSRLTKERVKTFSIGFEEEDYSELNYARIIAKRFNTDHHEFIVKPDAMEVLPKLVWHYDEPFGDSSSLPTYYVSKITSQYVKVALSGDGGDELFAGYNRYKAIKYISHLKKIPPIFLKVLANCGGLLEPFRMSRYIERVKRLLRVIETPLSDLYLQMMSFYDDYYKGRILYGYNPTASTCGGFISDKFNDADPVSAAEYADILTYLPHDILVKVDRASMANSLEVRCPFLDHEFVGLALTIPSALKLHNGESKYILKSAFSDILPTEIMRRGKMGFGIPLKHWFTNKLNDYLRDVVLSKQALARGYFKPVEVRRLIDEHSHGWVNHSDRLWLLLNLELWHRTFIDR
ncbi:MAG: asparagine synthase (glutamine-hydrolyzing) [Candidatus Schekmanbacteria bacterium RBG_16_38_10]|uniref:asparagine synthase (glutamine-hydrolyzing) n=1 Tax=Candidatus Schekmanbacteria bacterium RBG_16_38_10 TaxID=1817879 RepID=A0A1F7RP97_9BACT|nr:MAG: asparagine synthase (glutamine-hydrolyzing) [Candidatus Schekmanbacteria bacterium RBG_16_38_10]